MNAEVTMPIAQLDELRDSLKRSQEECRVLQGNKSKIELTVKLQAQERDYDRENMEYRMSGHGYGARSASLIARTNWDGTLSAIPSYARFKTVEQTIFSSFENVDHFTEPFTNIAREQVRSELNQAEQVASTAVQDLAIAKGDFANKKAQMIETFDKEVYELTQAQKSAIEVKNDEIELLKTEIKALKNEAITLSKDQQIKDLSEDLTTIMRVFEQYNGMGRWAKLTGTVEIPELKSQKKK